MSDLIKLGETDIELIDGDRGDNYPSKNDFFEKEFCLFLDANNISNNGFDFSSTHFITKEKDEKLKKGKLQKNDIVMMTRGSVGNVGLYDESVPFNNIRINSGMLIIRCHNDYNPLFLYYMLKSEFIRKQIADIMSGSVQKQLPVSALRHLLLFPQNEKSEIMETLSITDKKIKNNNVINAELEEMAKTIYDYWFLQFEFPNEEGKPYKSSGGKMVWNEEVKREIPDGWKVKKIGETFSSSRGISYNSKNLGEKGVPMINLASFKPGGGYKIEGIKRFSGDYDEDKSLKAYDLVMCNTQQTAIDYSKDIIGNAFLIPDIFESDIVSSHHVTTIKVKNENIKYYLCSLFNTKHFHRYIAGFTNGTNILGLLFNGVENYKSEIPDERTLERYSILCRDIEKRKSQIIKENQELTSLRDFLLPLLMNGQVGFKE